MATCVWSLSSYQGSPTYNRRNADCHLQALPFKKEINCRPIGMTWELFSFILYEFPVNLVTLISCRSKCLAQSLLSLQHIDPSEIFLRRRCFDSTEGGPLGFFNLWNCAIYLLEKLLFSSNIKKYNSISSFLQFYFRGNQSHCSRLIFMDAA